ncbi:MAG: hypothetical protein CL583_11760 [Alteromonadaceae bacterium]|nr:hypothetical protein [Alteromonadaceae bacterium]|tara:strand:+ start:1942 stop:3762 length:1821 start_codon:yes stop_codon:yes gene_type:complete
MNLIKHALNLNSLRSALAATVLLAASGTASAVPVSLELDFTCPFPLIGDQAVVADISSDMPEVVGVGEPVGPFDIDVTATVAEGAKIGLELVGAVLVEGTAEADVVIETPGEDLPLSVSLDIPPTEVPVEVPGSFDVPAFGTQPPIHFDDEHVGTATVRVVGLTLGIIARTADGSIAPAPIGEFTSVCALSPGQDNALHSFEIVYDEPDEPQNISVDPQSVDFGNVQAGLTESAVVTVYNDGDLPLGINGFGISGDDASAFSQSSDCSVVGPGESCAVNITYFPTDEGVQSARLMIESDDPDAGLTEVSLRGKSVLELVPEIVVESVTDFGQVELGSLVTQDVSIGNAGIGPLFIDEIAIVDNESGAFTFGHNCAVLEQDATCIVTVMFAPPMMGDFEATLSIASNDVASPTEVTLRGSTPTIRPVVFVLEFEGTTTIAASESTLNLRGYIDSDSDTDLTMGMLKGDLILNDTQAVIRVSHLFRNLKGTAEVVFEPVGETEGTLQGEVLAFASSFYIKLPRITVTLFGFPIRVGGGDDCRTMDPVTISMQSPEGEPFEIDGGGIVAGEYAVPPFQNCGPLTSVINGSMVGKGNTMELGLIPILAPI